MYKIFEIENYDTLKSAVDELCGFLLAENIPETRVFDSKLVAYELLGNVLKHSGGSASLHGRITERGIELKIVAERVFIPPTQGKCAELFSEHGRGLFLVDSVCQTRILTEDGELVVTVKIQ